MYRMTKTIESEKKEAKEGKKETKDVTFRVEDIPRQ